MARWLKIGTYYWYDIVQIMWSFIPTSWLDERNIFRIASQAYNASWSTSRSYQALFGIQYMLVNKYLGIQMVVGLAYDKSITNISIISRFNKHVISIWIVWLRNIIIGTILIRCTFHLQV